MQQLHEIGSIRHPIFRKGYSKTTIGVPRAAALKCCFPQENNTFNRAALGMEIVVLLKAYA
jgi:hypothetical protein